MVTVAEYSGDELAIGTLSNISSTSGAKEMEYLIVVGIVGSVVIVVISVRRWLGAPRCPVCGRPMVRRRRRMTGGAGGWFWGCAYYSITRCEGTRPGNA